MIVFTRIDNRLIHGQIVQGWLPSMEVDEVVVLSKEAVKSSLMQKMMRMSLPSGYQLNILTPSKALEHIKKEENLKIFLIIEDLQTLEELLKLGLIVETVTLGNTKFSAGKKQFSPGIFLSEEEISEIKQIEKDKHISFEIRSLPSSLITRVS